VLAPANQTSSPVGDHARPPRLDQPSASVRTPLPSTFATMTDPRSSPRIGRLKKAMCFPSREKRGAMITVSDWKRTFPIGYSRRKCPSTTCTTAKSSRSGAQSAAMTCSSTSLGAPPVYATRARMSFRMIAISPDFETAATSESCMPSGRVSGFPGRTMKMSRGASDHVAL
jgi:hypothetical protein